MKSKSEMQTRVYCCYLWGRLRSIPDMPVKLVLTMIIMLGSAWAWNMQDAAVAYADCNIGLGPLVENICYHFFDAYMSAAAIGILLLWRYPLGRKIAERRLESIGLLNHADECPKLVRKCRDDALPHVLVMIFRNCGIPLKTWEDKQTSIEAALNVSIVKITYGNSRNRVCIYAVPAKTNLPKVLPWREKFLSPENFVLKLGESLLGPVTVNLSHVPHVLLGGATGSGKSVLLKSLLMQAHHKGAEVYIADFKGGVDFPRVWHQKCRMCFNEVDLLDMLTQLISTMEFRKEILTDNECANIDEYNELTGANLPRIIFACDEVAEVLDKTGRCKEDKELIGKIESKISTIARQGRAFGIHLILATQRPDANILPGQIKNNVDFTVCGWANDVLARIILGNGCAVDQVPPKEVRGRFITNSGTVFQGYYFDAKQL